MSTCGIRRRRGSLAFSNGIITGNSTLIVVPQLGNELLLNGNFETGSPPSNWTANASGTLSSVADPRTGSLGTKCLNALRGTSNAVGYQILNNLDTSQWYFLDFWYKKVDNASMLAAGLTAAGTTECNPGYGTSTSWARKVGAWRPSNAANYISCQVQTSGNGRFDDASVKQLILKSLFATIPPSLSPNIIISVGVTRTTGTEAGIITHLDNPLDPKNFVLTYINLDATVKVDQWINGVPSNKYSGAISYSSGKLLKVKANGSTLTVYYNGVKLSDVSITAPTALRHGVFSTYSGNSFQNFTLTRNL